MKPRNKREREVAQLSSMLPPLTIQEDDIKNVKPVNARVVVNHTIELTEEDKRKAKEAALKEYEAKEMKRIEEARKKKLEKKADRVAKQEVAPSLFDFEG